MSAKLTVKLVASAVLFANLAGCSDGIKQSIRAHDFRASSRAERAANAPPPSPIANVADMPGWTTDLDGALAFAKDMGHKTVVFIQASNRPQSQTMKSSLVANQMTASLANSEKVTFDAGSSPELAARYGVPAPAIVILDSSGSAIGQQQGAVNKPALAAAVR